MYVRGSNEHGQLGQGDTAEYKSIRPVNALRGKWVVQIAAARDITLALTCTHVARHLPIFTVNMLAPYIANDEVFIWGSTAEPRTYAVPTLVEELVGNVKPL